MGQCASGHAKPAMQKERVEDHQKEEEQEEAEKLQL